MKIFSIPRKIRKALHVSQRKPLWKILSEFIWFKITRPKIARQYFIKYLFRKNVTNFSDYILTYKLENSIWNFNDMNYFSILVEKYNAEMFFTKSKLPIVRSFVYNTNSLFFKNGDVFQVNNSGEFLEFLATVREEGLWKGEELIVKKKEHSWGGKGIFKVRYADLLERSEILEPLFKEILESGYLFQEVICQHPELNRINPNSVNTLRFDTFINKNKVPAILCARLRTSAGTSFLDNISSGGLFVGINIEDGTLHEEGFNDFSKYSGEAFTQHPLTGTVFKGIEIPWFSEAKKLVLEAARLMPRAKVCAWDIAIQPEGPIIVEGNYYPGLLNSEIVQKGFRNHPVFQELLSEMEEHEQQKNKK